MLAEISKREPCDMVADELRSRLGEDDLATVGDRRDACGTGHLDSRIAVGGQQWFPAVETHAYADNILERELCAYRSRNGA